MDWDGQWKYQEFADGIQWEVVKIINEDPLNMDAAGVEGKKTCNVTMFYFRRESVRAKAGDVEQMQLGALSTMTEGKPWLRKKEDILKALVLKGT